MRWQRFRGGSRFRPFRGRRGRVVSGRGVVKMRTGSRFGVGEPCHGQNAVRMLYSHLVSSLRDGPGGVRVPLVVFLDLECLAISGCEFRSGLQDRFRGVRTVGTRTW